MQETIFTTNRRANEHETDGVCIFKPSSHTWCGLYPLKMRMNSCRTQRLVVKSVACCDSSSCCFRPESVLQTERVCDLKKYIKPKTSTRQCVCKRWGFHPTDGPRLLSDTELDAATVGGMDLEINSILFVVAVLHYNNDFLSHLLRFLQLIRHWSVV